MVFLIKQGKGEKKTRLHFSLAMYSSSSIAKLLEVPPAWIQLWKKSGAFAAEFRFPEWWLQHVAFRLWPAGIDWREARGTAAFGAGGQETSFSCLFTFPELSNSGLSNSRLNKSGTAASFPWCIWVHQSSLNRWKTKEFLYDCSKEGFGQNPLGGIPMFTTRGHCGTRRALGQHS